MTPIAYSTGSVPRLKERTFAKPPRWNAAASLLGLFVARSDARDEKRAAEEARGESFSRAVVANASIRARSVAGMPAFAVINRANHRLWVSKVLIDRLYPQECNLSYDKAETECASTVSRTPRVWRTFSTVS